MPHSDRLLTLVLALCAFCPLRLSSQPGSRSAYRVVPYGPQLTFHEGWSKEKFPAHAVCYQSPEQIAEIYSKSPRPGKRPVIAREKPADGSLRIVGTGTSYTIPGFNTLPTIARAAGFNRQTLLTHTGGGVTGSAAYKWEQENGIFRFEGKPTPKLMASIANAEWDCMIWGRYFSDRIEFFSCWIDFCRKYNPQMKFYLTDAWPATAQLDPAPRSEAAFSDETITRMGKATTEAFNQMVDELNRKHGGIVHVIPTCEAMVLAVQYFNRGALPGIEGIHKSVGGKQRSLWRDQAGHLGPSLMILEGYVFYATIYGRSPESIKDSPQWTPRNGLPTEALDKVYREIAWKAVLNNPHSGVQDANQNGIADDRE